MPTEPAFGPRPTDADVVDHGPLSGTHRKHLAMEAVPRVAVSPAELRALPLDHRAGFLVWLVDGQNTIETILDACPIGRDHALAILGVLAAHGVIWVD